MANPCSCRYAFYADNESKSELLRLYNKLSAIMKPASVVKSSDDPSWLGNVAIAHDLNMEVIPCRGSIEDLGDYEPSSDFFTLECETAWAPMDKLWETVVAQYKGIAFVYIAEEPGSDIYTNTDVDGRFFPDRYLLEIWGDISIPEDWYAGQQKPDCLDIREYFSNLDSFMEYCANFTSEKFNTFEEWQYYFSRVFERVGNVIVGVHEFTPN